MPGAPRRAVVLAAIASVIDPCSQFNGSHLNLVELGMIQDVKVASGGQVEVTMLLDDPTCLYASTICREVTAAALRVPGVDSVEVMITPDELWTSEHLTLGAREKLARWREQRQAKYGQPTPVQLPV